MQTPSWYRSSRFLLHVEYPFPSDSYGEPFPMLQAEDVANALSRIKPDAVQIVVKDHAGFVPYSTSYGNAIPGVEYAGGPDLIEIYGQATTSLELPLILGYATLSDRRAGDQRSEWLRRDAHGHAYPNRALCPNAGYVEELLLPQLEELSSRYHPEGFWLDGELWTVSPCYCSACETEFQLLHNHSAPLSRRDSFWSEWLAFQRDSYGRYLDRVSRYLQDHNPGLLLAAAGAYGSAQAEATGSAVNRLTGDVSPAFSTRQIGLETRVLSGRGIPWDLMTWNRCSARPWPAGNQPALPAYPKGTSHLCQEGAQILAHDGRWTVWMTASAGGLLSPAEVEQVAAAADFARVHAGSLDEVESAAYVAVLHSDTTHRRAGNGLFDAGPCLDRLRGALQALQELQHPHDVLTEDQLSQRLDSYRVLVLPECTALPLEADEVIREWVRRGGRLLATGRVSPRLNEAVPTFALEDVLGIQWTGGKRTEGVVLFKGHPIRLLAPLYEIRCETAVPLHPLAEASRYGVREADGYPMVTENEFGAGKACYVACDLFAAYHRCQYPGLRDVVGEILSTLLPEPPLVVDLPPWIDVVLRQGEGITSAHFLNLSPGKSLAQNSPFIESIPRTESLSVCLEIPGEAHSVRLQPQDVEARWSQSERTVTFFIPPFEIHTCAVIRYARSEPEAQATPAESATEASLVGDSEAASTPE